LLRFRPEPSLILSHADRCSSKVRRVISPTSSRRRFEVRNSFSGSLMVKPPAFVRGVRPASRSSFSASHFSSAAFPSGSSATLPKKKNWPLIFRNHLPEGCFQRGKSRGAFRPAVLLLDFAIDATSLG
jgi:hypothetical protein